MGVSAVAESNLDLDALVAGGKDFVDRIAALKTAKAAHDQSLSDLNLGQSAKSALAQAEIVLAEAKEKRDRDLAELAAEVQSAKDQLNSWVAGATEDTKAQLSAAAKAMAEAQKFNSVAVDDRNEARKELERAEVHTANLISSAQAKAKATLDAANDQANTLMSDARFLKKQAEDTLASAQALEAKFKSALATIQSAASATME